MGKVQQRAGGGKATVENLAAGNVKSGVTVTVKQGSKTVQQVTGTLGLRMVNVGSYRGSQNIPVTALLAQNGLGVDDVTVNNFFISAVSAPFTTASGYSDSTNHIADANGFNMQRSYANGTLSVSGAAQLIHQNSRDNTQYISYSVVLVYLG